MRSGSIRLPGSDMEVDRDMVQDMHFLRGMPMNLCEECLVAFEEIHALALRDPEIAAWYRRQRLIVQPDPDPEIEAEKHGRKRTPLMAGNPLYSFVLFPREPGGVLRWIIHEEVLRDRAKRAWVIALYAKMLHESRVRVEDAADPADAVGRLHRAIRVLTDTRESLHRVRSAIPSDQPALLQQFSPLIESYSGQIRAAQQDLSQRLQQLEKKEAPVSTPSRTAPSPLPAPPKDHPSRPPPASPRPGVG
ncbi:MAG: hypothetical protein Greene041619_661 [Candidatus Peregrinibacteria bacterium Greene0416_19]|nr:MAG: hypothetical protein Greene041619_661 [Candidatus Peregrinibacteria bacterium Greene0416_19]